LVFRPSVESKKAVNRAIVFTLTDSAKFANEELLTKTDRKGRVEHRPSHRPPAAGRRQGANGVGQG
jgi:hypothetical protein